MTSASSILRRSAAHAALAVATVALVGVTATACGEAESRNAPDDGQATQGRDVETAPRRLPTGTTLTFTVDEGISTESTETGDVFTASLVRGVQDARGDEALPPGTSSRWVVTESSTQDGTAVLAVRLQSVRIAGEWTPVQATIADAAIETREGDSDTETAAKIGIGAAAGALIGQAIGRNAEGTLAGAGVGAAVGTAIALSSRDGTARLPAGSTMTVTLDEPVTIS